MKRWVWKAAMLKVVIGGLILFSNTLVAQAEMTGNDLHFECTFTKASKDSYCFHYILGAQDGLLIGASITSDQYNKILKYPRADIRFLTNILGYCTQGQRNEKIISAVTSYLSDNPAQRHQPAIALVLKALRKAFPCAE